MSRGLSETRKNCIRVHVNSVRLAHFSWTLQRCCFFPPPPFICNKQHDQTENALTVRANTSLPVVLFFFCFFLRATASLQLLVWKWRCTWHCGKHAIIRPSPPPAAQRAQVGPVMQSKHGSSEVFYFPHGQIGPSLTSLHTRMPQHICSDASWRAKHCVTLCFFAFFFFLTQENGLVKLVGWNILMVGDIDITSADMFFIFLFFSVGITDTWDQITAWHGQLN